MSFENDYIYDIETYPNVFTCSIKHHASGDRAVFEVSERRNMLSDFIGMMYRLIEGDCRMVGFNNLSFDYPVIHFIMQNPTATVEDIWDKAQAIISTPFENRFAHTIWARDQLVKQIDLYKIHHFDNPAKATSLKMIEYNRRSQSIQDLPYPPGTILTPDQIDNLVLYNDKDVDETEGFYIESKPLIKFRDTLSMKYRRDFTNHNDVKIGTDYFIMRLEEAMPGVCYYKDTRGRKKPRQTHRDGIHVKNILFPYIRFDNPDLRRIHRYFYGQTIINTNKSFDGLTASVNGFEFDFGTGGLHGSIAPQTVYATDTHDIIDVDVRSYYPAIAIANALYPEHLTSKFCEIYADVKAQRMTHKKGTPENAMLKLALNGTFGQTNSKFSPLYDPQYTMAITINGQLLLVMLAEWVMSLPGLSMIQANTDGITVLCPKSQRETFFALCRCWETITGLELEDADYIRMFIRDVNNYIAEYKGTGKLKHKGAYLLNHSGAGKDAPGKRGWHQNQSALVVPKAAEAALVRGEDAKQFIRSHTDPFDFMLRTKIQRTHKLMWGDTEEQRITRYYISKSGKALTKVMPPLARQLAANPDAPDRVNSIEKGWNVTVCNEHADIDWADLDYSYYIKEARKLIDPVR